LAKCQNFKILRWGPTTEREPTKALLSHNTAGILQTKSCEQEACSDLSCRARSQLQLRRLALWAIRLSLQTHPTSLAPDPLCRTAKAKRRKSAHIRWVGARRKQAQSMGFWFTW